MYLFNEGRTAECYTNSVCNRTEPVKSNDHKGREALSEKRTFKMCQKVGICLNGLVYGLWPKMKLFSHLRFWSNQVRKDLFLIFWIEKKMLFGPEKRSLKSAKKPTISKEVTPWFLSNNRTFSHLCFLGRSSQKRSFFFVIFWI